MDRAGIASVFKALVAQHLEVAGSEISEESTFVQLGADSIDQTELLLASEEEFSLTPESDSEYSDIDTVGKAIDFIFKKTR